MKVERGVLLSLLLLIFSHSSISFHHRQCTRATRADFSYPDCYLPELNNDLDLTSASFLLSHNAATGYINPNSLSKTGLSWPYSKNQIGSVYQQLNDGARALDLRPLLLTNGTVIFAHGSIQIDVDFETLVGDAVAWCKDNPDELVLLFTNHFQYQDYSSGDGDRYKAMVNTLSTVYQKYGIAYLPCGDIAGLTVGDAMDIAALPQGGYLIAIDGQDGSSSCIKENYVESRMVTCYNPTYNVSCRSSSLPFETLLEYMEESATNEATDNYWQLGPPADLNTYPFNEIQALWQVDLHAVLTGMRRASSILVDNRASNLNAMLVDYFYERSVSLGSMSLVALDNLNLHGNAVLSVLRNTCGQTSLQECGRNVPKPRLGYFHITMKQVVYAFLVGYFVTSLYVFWTTRRKSKMWNTIVARAQEATKHDCGPCLDQTGR